MNTTKSMHCLDKHIFGPLLATAVFSSTLFTPAFAEIEEIVVQARKTQENLQDVPVAVTAFTGDFFSDSGLTEFSDIGKLTPNFDIQEDGVSGSAFSNLTIRGQTALNRELSSDQAVGITVNGAPITRGTNLFSNLFDVEQIEVLKGPQGTLFGKNTTGGAVVVRTTAPKLGEFEAYVEGDVGDFDRADIDGIVNIPIGETFALRLGFANQNRDGFNFGTRRVGPAAGPVGGDPTFPGDTIDTDQEFADDNEEFYRLSALWEPNERLSIRINADYHEVDESIQGTQVLNVGGLDLSLVGVPVPPDTLFTSVAIPTPINDPEFGFRAVSHQQDSVPNLEAEEYNINGTIIYDFDSFTFTSITSYRDQEVDQNNPFAGNTFVFGGQDSDIFAQEVRFSGVALQDRLQWQFGGFLANEEGIDVDNVGSFRTTQSDNETLAVFAQGTYTISDHLNFTGGLRFTDQTRALAIVNNAAADGTPGPLVPEQEVSFDAFSWTVGLDYQVAESALVYGTVSRGFRSGGIDDESLDLTLGPQLVNGVLTDITVDDITIRPEFVVNYELGFKADFLNSSVRWNSAVFFSDYTDIQVQTFDPVLTSPDGQALVTLANGAEATIWGFESELNYAPNDNFSFGATVGYTNAEFDEFIDVDLASGIVTDRTDEALGGPEWQFSAFGRYEANLTNNIRGGFQLNYTYRGEEELLGGTAVAQFADPSQAVLDSYGIFNAQLDFDIEGFGAGTNIAIYARNLFDNDHHTTGFALVAFGLDLAQRAPGAPQLFGVRIRQSF